MSISVADNFAFLGSKPLDARIKYDTVSDMKAAVEATLYDGCLSYVTATGKYYTFNSTNEVDSTTGKWREFTGGGAGGSISDLDDIDISSAQDGQSLVYDSTEQKWVNGEPSGGDIEDMADVEITNPSDGEVLTYDATAQKWVNASGGSASVDELGDIGDVDLSSLADGQTIVWDATNSKWVNGTPSGGASDLTDLGDVNVSSPTNGQVLKYNSTSQKWENGSSGGGSGSGGTVVGYTGYPEASTTVDDFIAKVNALSSYPDITYSGGLFYNLPADNIALFVTPTRCYITFSEYPFLFTSSRLYRTSGYVCSISKTTTDGSNHPGYMCENTLTNGFQTYTSQTFKSTWTYDTDITDNDKEGYFYVTRSVGYDSNETYSIGAYKNRTIIVDGIQFYSDAECTQLITPELGKVYVDIETGDIYRWNGLNYNKVATDFDMENKYDIWSSNYTDINDGDFVPMYDASANTAKRSYWSNIKSFLKTYFDTLYFNVKTRQTPASGGTDLSPVTTGDMYTWNNKQDTMTAGTNITISGTTINAVGATDMTFSTSERAVGKWIDNKTLYQRTFSGTTSSNSAVTSVASFSSSYSIKEFNGGFIQATGVYVPINYCNGNAPTNDYMIPYTESGYIKIEAGANNRGKSYWMTVLYTK